MLQRSHQQLAPLDDARVLLEPDRSAGVPAVLDVNGDDAVQLDRNLKLKGARFELRKALRKIEPGPFLLSQGELFPDAAPGPQFYPVSAIDFLTGYLMAFGAMVALARRTREGGSWLVRISLAQVGRWLILRGQVPEAELKDVPKEFTPAELERWSMTSNTPVGRLQHLGPVVRFSETPPRWARPTVPLGYHQPVC